MKRLLSLTLFMSIGLAQIAVAEPLTPSERREYFPDQHIKQVPQLPAIDLFDKYMALDPSISAEDVATALLKQEPKKFHDNLVLVRNHLNTIGFNNLNNQQVVRWQKLESTVTELAKSMNSSRIWRRVLITAGSTILTPVVLYKVMGRGTGAASEDAMAGAFGAIVGVPLGALIGFGGTVGYDMIVGNVHYNLKDIKILGE